jgi:hypothetical protein
MNHGWGTGSGEVPSARRTSELPQEADDGESVTSPRTVLTEGQIKNAAKIRENTMERGTNILFPSMDAS